MSLPSNGILLLLQKLFNSNDRVAQNPEGDYIATSLAGIFMLATKSHQNQLLFALVWDQPNERTENGTTCRGN